MRAWQVEVWMARNGRGGSDRLVRLATTVVIAVVLLVAVVAVLAVRGCASTKPATASSKAAPKSAESSAAPKPSSSSAVTQASVPTTPVADPATDQFVPVLMYHHVSPTAKNSIAITPAVFDEQMRYLRDHGYHAIHVAQLADFLATGRRLPEKPVLITFDDGRSNQMQYAVPILKEYGFTATFFVNQKWVDSKSSSFMHRDDLKKLVAWGYDVESHTRSHTFLIRKHEDYAGMKKRLWDQTYNHRIWLEGVIGRPVIAIAYPGGGYDDCSPRLVRESGHILAFTTDDGLVSYKGQSAQLLPRYNAGARGFSMGSFAAVCKRAETAAAKARAKESKPGTGP